MASEVIVNPPDPGTAVSERTRPGGKPGSLVTVIVSCCGQLEYTRLCAPSLLRFTRQPYELFFLDCDSLDGTAEYLDGFAAAAPVRVEVARVPAEPSGAGRKDEQISIRGEFIAFLNNDTIVTQGWLDSLVSAALALPEAGMVAPMSNHAAAALLVDPVPYGIDDWDGDDTPRLQQVLAQVDKVNAFAKEWKEHNRNQACPTESLDGGCALVKREVFQKLGLFPTRTPPGHFRPRSPGQPRASSRLTTQTTVCQRVTSFFEFANARGSFANARAAHPQGHLCTGLCYQS